VELWHPFWHLLAVVLSGVSCSVAGFFAVAMLRYGWRSLRSREVDAEKGFFVMAIPVFAMLTLLAAMAGRAMLYQWDLLMLVT
jgi:hypothetical protein